MIFLIEYTAYVLPVLIGWYTFNIARLAWAGGNKAGAWLTGGLAVAAAAFSVSILLFSKS